jgi:hypothetical protein
VPLTINRYKYLLHFSISKTIMQQIRDWEYKLDKVVFDEQIATGSYRDGLKVPDIMLVKMKLMRSKGQVAPYYGAIGAGACYYRIQIIFPRCRIAVQHSALNEKLTLINQVKIIQYDTDTDKNDNLNTAANWFRIEASEYQTLIQWNYWHQEKEFTGRYVYCFSPTSLGVGKKVIDTISGDEINVVDYSKW